MVRFGMPTLLESGTPEDCAALCHEIGLDFVELNMNMPEYQPGNFDVPLLRDLAKRYGIFYTIHPDENLNVSDFNPYVAEGYTRTVLETVDAAAKLGVPIINMHLSNGVYFTLPDGRAYLFERYKERYLESIRKLCRDCEKAAGGSGVRICVENCSGFTGFQKEALEILLDSPVFGLTFDVGHSHSCGGLDEEYILTNRASLYHIHLHDARGPLNHLPLGSGEVDIGRYLALAGERDCTVVLETKTVEGLKSSAEWIDLNAPPVISQ